MTTDLPTPPEAAPPPPPPGRRRWLPYAATVIVTAVVTAVLAALLLNIAERKREGEQHFFKVVELTEDTVDPAEWGRNFPRQYESYLRTAEDSFAPRGGSEALAPSHLEADP